MFYYLLYDWACISRVEFEHKLEFLSVSCAFKIVSVCDDNAAEGVETSTGGILTIRWNDFQMV